jgi:hypothetical protein
MNKEEYTSEIHTYKFCGTLQHRVLLLHYGAIERQLTIYRNKVSLIIISNERVENPI